MKKWLTIILSFLMLFGFTAPAASAAESNTFCNQYKGVKKIWWDGVELKSGQIGRLTVLKDTTLYKLQGEKKVPFRTLKKGEFYRIYAFKPGKLSVGGGYYVDRDSKVKYETPSKTKLRAAQCIHNPYGKKGNPTTVGVTWDMTANDWMDGKKKYQITMTEAVTDANQAWQMMQQANSLNPPPPAGKKYILAKFKIKLIEFEGKTFDSWMVNKAMFDTVTQKGALNDHYIGFVPPSPELQDLYKGGQTEGWVPFVVDANDNPYIVWNRGWEDELWFKVQ